MFWAYVGWRMLRRVRVVLLVRVLAGVVLIGHPQAQLRQALDGRGVIGARIHQLGHQLQHGLEQHLRPPDERSTRHPQEVERSGSR
jgi:hypothetical protein